MSTNAPRYSLLAAVVRTVILDLILRLISDFIGDYCDVADLVLEMRNYECHDITEKARQVSLEFPSAVRLHEGALYVMRYDPSY